MLPSLISRDYAYYSACFLCTISVTVCQFRQWAEYTVTQPLWVVFNLLLLNSHRSVVDDMVHAIWCGTYGAASGKSSRHLPGMPWTRRPW